MDEKPVAPYPLLRRITSQFESYARLKSIELVLDFRGSQELQILMDEDKFGKIFNNLLSNALKFTPEKGRITIRLYELDYSMHLQVEDNGRGIHPDDLPHVFDRFFQTGRPGVPAEGGTGIGLALCKEYARLFEGKISVESTLGTGSIFHFIFPKKEVFVRSEDNFMTATPEMEKLVVEENVIPTQPLAKATAEPKTSDRPLLLVVEDNPHLRDYIQIVLDEKYRVLTAENGQIAIDLLNKNSPQSNPDLIISDIMMPVMDGFQLLEKVKRDERLRHIPFIMLTARADIEDKLKALRTGVDDYLLKPFEETELLIRVSNLIERFRERTAYAQLQLPMKEAAKQADGFDSEEELTEGQAAWLEQLENQIFEEVANDLLSVSWLAKKQFLSERQLYRRLKVLTGLSPNQFIQEIRLIEARRLLETGAAESLYLVSKKVGFKSSKYFSKLFMERFGKSPTDYFI